MEIVLEALFYRLRNAGPWRDLPGEFGSWETIYGWFRAFVRNGLWDKFLNMVARAKGKVRLVDGTHIRCHQCATNPRGGAAAQAMGATRGGRNTKLMALTDSRGRAMALKLIPGQAYEGKHVAELLPRQPGVIVVGDKGFDDDALRAAIEALGHSHCFPTKSNRTQKRPFSRKYYRMRYAVEDFFRRLKRWGSTATRRDKLAECFLAWVQMASVLDWMMP